MKVVKDVQSCAEGDLSRRGKPKCRGVKIGEELLRAVDDLVVEEFEREKKTLRRLNCLVYAGAVVVTNRTQHPSKTRSGGLREERRELLDKEPTCGG